MALGWANSMRRHLRAAGALALTGLLFLAGCEMETRVIRDSFPTLRQLADKPPGELREGRRQEQTVEDDGWAILLKEFEGKNRDQDARELTEELTEKTNLNDVWARKAGAKTQVLRGRYPEPTVDAAQRDLRQTRMLKIDLARPFSEVGLIPLGAASEGSSGPLDLRQHHNIYSLQIAFYDQDFGPEFRKAAEQAAQTLRAEGEEAYYYHGPNRSLVTLGIFREEDFVRTANTYAYPARARMLQQKYPYNLGNGLTLVEKKDGKKLGEQPSFLVKIR